MENNIYKNILSNHFIQFSLIGNDLSESAVAKGWPKNLRSYENFIGGNAILELDKGLNLRITYILDEIGNNELSKNIKKKNDEAGYYLYRLTSGSYKANTGRFFTFNSSTISKELDKNNLITLSVGVNVDNPLENARACIIPNFCDSACLIPGLSINTYDPLTLSYTLKYRKMILGIDYGEEMEDITYGSFNPHSTFEPPEFEGKKDLKTLGLFGKNTRRGVHSHLCFSDNIKFKNNNYDTKLLLDFGCFQNYFRLNNLDSGVREVNPITDKGYKALNAYSDNNFLYSYGAEILAYQTCKDMFRIRLNSCIENNMINFTSLYQRKINPFCCKKESCNDTVGFYLMSPDHLARDYIRINKDTKYTYPKEEKTPVICGLNYCTNIFGIIIPIFFEKYYNLNGYKDREGFFYGIRPIINIQKKTDFEINNLNQCCVEGGDSEEDMNNI